MIGIYTPLRDIRRYLKLHIFSLRTRLWLSMLRTRYHLMKIPVKMMEHNVYNYKGDYVLKDQISLIRRKEFNTLIILDACRYDVFSEVIYKYLDGRLKVVVSPASTTGGWLKQIWGYRLWPNIVYISASPMVNKRGLLKVFDARNKFLDIVEVWDWGWDKKLCTVPPKKVNLGVKIALIKMRLQKLIYPRDYMLVIHYVQPHAPYIALRHLVAKISDNEVLSRDIRDISLRKLGRFTGKFSIDYILLGLLKDCLKSDERVRDNLYRVYRKNLEWVLEYVAELSSHLGGKIVITSDHGELLGEYGLYFHVDLPLPTLRWVPWFIIK